MSFGQGGKWAPFSFVMYNDDDLGELISWNSLTKPWNILMKIGWAVSFWSASKAWKRMQDGYLISIHRFLRYYTIYVFVNVNDEFCCRQWLSEDCEESVPQMPFEHYLYILFIISLLWFSYSAITLLLTRLTTVLAVWGCVANAAYVYYPLLLLLWTICLLD